jgi:hypothetical protein
MLWLVAGITLALVSLSATLGGVGTGLLALATIAWLLLAFRPVELGPIVADLARRRFE